MLFKKRIIATDAHGCTRKYTDKNMCLKRIIATDIHG